MFPVTASTNAIELPESSLATNTICFEQYAELSEDAVLWVGDQRLRFWLPQGLKQQKNIDLENLLISEEALNDSAANFDLLDSISVRSSEQIFEEIFTTRRKLTFKEALQVEQLINARLKSENIEAREAESQYWTTIFDDDLGEA